MNREMGPTPAKLEAMRAKVLGEIAKFPGGIEPYLNNFRNWLRPARVTVSANYRAIIISGRDPAKPHREQMLPGDEIEKHSKTWLNDTPVSFEEAIDQAMSTYGITAERVQIIDEDADSDYIIGDMKHLMLSVYLIKPFIWLRTKGYNRMELTQ